MNDQSEDTPISTFNSTQGSIFANLEMKEGPMVAPMPTLDKVETAIGDEMEESSFLNMKDRVIEVIKMEPTAS